METIGVFIGGILIGGVLMFIYHKMVLAKFHDLAEDAINAVESAKTIAIADRTQLLSEVTIAWAKLKTKLKI